MTAEINAPGQGGRSMKPEGWQELALSDVIKLASGDSRPSDVSEAAVGQSHIPIYGGNGVLGFSTKANSNEDDIIIGRVGEYCGITRFVRGEKWITDNALYVKSIQAGFDRRFLALQIQHFDLSRLRAKGGQPLVSQQPIYGLRFRFPPEEEQKAIARAVETWDRAIETVEALIVTARAQKTALLKALLTGKQRFPGFTGEWCKNALDDLFWFKKGRGLSKNVVNDHGAKPCILYGELYTRYPEVVGEIVGRTDVLDGESSVAGDVLIPGSTTTSGIDLANATALLQEGVLLGGDINILRPKKPGQSAPFFAYLLTHAMRAEIASRAQGVTIIHLYGSDLKPIEVGIPSHDEQHAIARVLMTTDAEVLALKAQLAALRTEKAGVMQQLLTGKRRITKCESEAG